MSEAERVLRDSRQGSLKQSGGHRERELRDRWAELLLGDSSCGDVATELADIAEGLQEYDSWTWWSRTIRCKRAIGGFVERTRSSWSLRKSWCLLQ